MPAINYNKVAALPHVVRSFCYGHEAWIVGSAATYLLDLKDDGPRDYDILVPLWTWGVACRSIPEGSSTNAHGGVKFSVGGASVDVWGGDIGWFLAQVPAVPAYAVHPKSMTWLLAERSQTRIKSADTFVKVQIDRESFLRP